jgi:hypothetical protein
MRFREYETGKVMVIEKESIVAVKKFTEVTIHRKGIPVKFVGEFVNENDVALVQHELCELDEIVKRRIGNG